MVKKKVGSLGLDERRALIEPGIAQFSQRTQCAFLGIHRSGLYYEPQKPTLEDLELMRAIDEEYLQHLYYGRRRMTVEMLKKGFFVGQKKIRTAMQLMGLEAIYPKPNLSTGDKEHKKFPYLLRGVTINHPDQAWGADISVPQQAA